MKLRSVFIVLALIFSGLAFSSCSDESESIVPAPVSADEAAATVGTGGEDDDPMK
ncbi:hypothetical protein JMN32_03735 [Fulvivirga sp. 29W222]|uniref:Uncharacterized protein n=1 Tax=Fulvivirga marina TaxID=2494733 RepID=A0A937FUX8_9BACT|nr:hypothetical protein [Fulvivirga marina]MBL6445402.1 hypothetical protein [Fulvivirga marina]